MWIKDWTTPITNPSRNPAICAEYAMFSILNTKPTLSWNTHINEATARGIGTPNAGIMRKGLLRVTYPMVA